MARIVIEVTTEELRSLQAGRTLVGRSVDGTEVELCPVPAGRFFEIGPRDVGRATIGAFGQVWPVANFMGRVLPGDVGKRVYRVPMHDKSGYILQVENDAQRDARLGR
jgi:hypothetical protein